MPQTPTKFSIERCFRVAKVIFAISGENLRNIAALALRNELVGINKPMAGQSGKTTAHRGFPASHESDENEIG